MFEPPGLWDGAGRAGRSGAGPSAQELQRGVHRLQQRQRRLQGASESRLDSKLEQEGGARFPNPGGEEIADGGTEKRAEEPERWDWENRRGENV